MKVTLEKANRPEEILQRLKPKKINIYNNLPAPTEKQKQLLQINNNAIPSRKMGKGYEQVNLRESLDV